MMAVDRAMQREFKVWKEDRKREKRAVFYTDEKEQFLKEKFQIMSKDQKIFNIIKTFFVEDVDHFIKTDGVRENQLACSKTKEQEQNEHKIGRKKRSTAACTGDTLSTPNTCLTNSCEAKAVNVEALERFRKWLASIPILMKIEGGP